MIAYLRGKILQKGLNFLIVENNGLGYKLFVTPELLERKAHDELEVYTYLKSGDDGQTLFGLPDFPTLQFFELLITITGVGPKMALTIVSAAKIEVLQQAIVNQDVEIFTRMSGVGKKTAERIILELKTKISGGMLSPTGISGSDVYDALIGLGYNPREVREAVSKLDSNSDTEQQLKQALKLLSA
jgi:holliday junction DNA helicase RuvA